jgi:hypothetical protein
MCASVQEKTVHKFKKKKQNLLYFILGFDFLVLGTVESGQGRL